MKNLIKVAIALTLGLIATTAFGQDRSILFVLDTSGSMNDAMSSVELTRLQVAKNALNDVINELPDSTNVGIYSFRGWEYEMSRLNKQKALSAINSINRGGGRTPLYGTLKNSATNFLKFRSNQGNHGSYKIVIITDGAATDANLNKEGRYNDGTKRPSMVEDIMNRGMVIDTIGLDMAGDHDLKNQINGNYMKGDDPKSLQQSLRKAVAEVSAADGAEGFEEIQGLPVSFAYASVKGLTSYLNHPIGTLPPKPPVPKNTDQSSSVTPTSSSVVDDSEGIGAIVGSIAGIAIFAFVAVVVSIVLLNR